MDWVDAVVVNFGRDEVELVEVAATSVLEDDVSAPVGARSIAVLFRRGCWD